MDRGHSDAQTVKVMKRHLPLMLLSMLFAAANAAAKSPAACELLSRDDVQSVQGAAFAETKQTQAQFDGVVTSQCFYRLPLFVESISVDVLRPQSSETTAEELWEKITGKRVAKMTAKGRNAGQSLDGLGTAAIWAGNKSAGALYVLKDDAILRISVGGGGTEEEKIAKTRKLAEKALAKME